MIDPVAGSQHDQDLVGTDINGDGVRDDVAAYITSLDSDPSKQVALTEFARASTVMMLLGATADATRDDAYVAQTKVVRSIDCLASLYPPAERQARVDALHDALYNNAARLRAYLAADALLSGSILPAPETGCDGALVAVPRPVTPRAQDAPVTDPLCGNGTAFYFGNGANKTAIDTDAVVRDVLPGLAFEAKLPEPVKYDAAYNQTAGFLLDILQTLEQKAIENDRFSWYFMNNALGYVLRGAAVPGWLLDEIPGGAETIAIVQNLVNTAIAESMSHRAEFYDADVAAHVEKYRRDIDAGYRVLVVAHSQGTLYANAARARLITLDGDPDQCFGAALVGNAAEVAPDGYVTSDNDAVIGLLTKLGRTVPRPNVHVPVTLGDLSGHGFVETYTNALLPARKEVVSLIARIAARLRVCNDLDAHIFTPDDVAGIVNCTTLSSIFVDQTATVDTIELPHLIAIGSIYLSGDTLTQFRAPVLERVGDMTSFANGLTTIDLPNLRTVSNDFRAPNHRMLQTVNVPALTTVGGTFELYNDPVLQTVNASALTSVGDSLSGSFDLHDDPVLQTVNVPALTTVGRSFDLHGDPVLQTVNMSALTTVRGDLDLSSDPMLQTVDAPALTTVAGAFALGNNVTLQTVNVSALTTVGLSLSGRFDLHGDPVLQTVNASALTTVGGSFFLDNDLMLQTVDVSALTTVGFDFFLGNDPRLQTVDVSALTTVGGGFFLGNDPMLHTVDISTLATVRGEFFLDNDLMLQAVRAPALASVGGDFFLHNDPMLQAVDISALATVGGEFFLGTDPLLQAVDISALVTVGSRFVLSNNCMLQTANASALATVGFDFFISGNPSLRALLIPALASIGANVDIDSNPLACVAPASYFESIARGSVFLANNGNCN